MGEIDLMKSASKFVGTLKHFNSLVNYKLSRTVKSKRQKSLKYQVTLNTTISQALSNYQILVFYSEQRHITIPGYATNWNSTGYFEVYHNERK